MQTIYESSRICRIHACEAQETDNEKISYDGVYIHHIMCVALPCVRSEPQEQLEIQAQTRGGYGQPGHTSREGAAVPRGGYQRRASALRSLGQEACTEHEQPHGRECGEYHR